MTTAIEIIRPALRKIGAVDAVETPTAEQFSIGLEALNNLVDELGVQPQAAYNNEEVVVTLPAGTKSLTIGPSKQIDVPRPFRIESAYARINGIDRTIDPISKPEYDEILVKTIGTAWPDVLFYDQGVPTGTVYFWPVPASTVELHITVLLMIREWTDVASDSQDLPKGYRNMLINQLAVALCPFFALPVPDDLARQAAMSLKVIKRQNASVPILGIGTNGVSRLGQFLSGGL